VSDGAQTRFAVVSDRSAVLVRARSNVGSIEFGTNVVTGSVSAKLERSPAGTALSLDPSAVAALDIDVTTLTSGNPVYDAELRRRVDANRFPLASLALDDVHSLGDDLYEVEGHLTFHDVSRALRGSVQASVVGDTLTVVGEQVVDIRDFEITTPSLLMLRIYPDVRVYLHLEADVDSSPSETGGPRHRPDGEA
jgi:polyisoprenoid-binding protein YceI